MNRDEAREAAWRKFCRENGDTDIRICAMPANELFNAGYESREDVASALRSALRELTNAWGYHQSEYVCEDPRLDEATANAERLLKTDDEDESENPYHLTGDELDRAVAAKIARESR